jgi:lipopolysaccharide/colanic/teichoic acid biosynthesis glycosyltransferase
VFDLVAASLLLVVLSPLMLLIAIAIKASSRGPILFRQQRLMKDGVEFTLLKFRTMVDGADGMLDKVFYLNEAKGPLFKVRKDPRITRLGRVLRKTFLDELPQLMNVVRGEMSLVGPRPILAREVSDLPGRVVFRFAVPQGVTGPWQTHGHHQLTFDQQLAVERSYIETWSLLGDLLILTQTVGLVLFRRGA